MRFRIFCLLVLLSVSARAQPVYRYTADLKNISNDKVVIELQTPALKESEAVFSFAKAIPGSYSRKDFGRFIDDLEAYDKEGKSLKADKLNDNQYRIRDAEKLARITYKVNDTWESAHKNFIFQPGGSNIDAGKDFVINNHAFFGYFEGYSNLPFEIRMIKPAEMYGATHLTVNRDNPEEDILTASSFFVLADNPVIYARPDTTSFMAGNTRINVSVYSVNSKVKSAQVAGFLKPMSAALQKFFNGLPVDSYQFLYFFEDPRRALTDREKGQGGYGALEHNYSSLYYLPEMAYEPQLKKLVNEVSGHEFLHILTPLNLHSEQIAAFDFTSPKMSQHLWLYEGVTEYFAHLVQLQNGLLTEKEFFNNMRTKINQAEEYGDFSMTEMSAHVMEDDWQKKYNSVYNRGALIGFMLDVLIREKTAGKKDLKSVIMQLTRKYGPNKPFKDAQLFDDIIQLSHPAVKDFIASYITGAEPLPFPSFFNKIGYEFQPEKKVVAYYAGELALKYDETAQRFAFADVKNNTLGVKDDDLFVKINDINVTSANINDIWEKYFQANTTEPEVSLTITRNGEAKILSGKLDTGYFKMKNYLAPAESKTDGQDYLLRLISNRPIEVNGN
ncbi:M61 family metallopeptidase [Hufsiella ginkgonis]|uniref:Peptidase M61 n=1 Tax=Hufsiella ginkgonis TaxID=2695274 RepID=A0A7K1XV52_9SPHI|nr:peptidase M61 [Hufsiella ginkgonis]MXV14386.1 peptidase M61 [Hufsiella ginkgonis]